MIALFGVPAYGQDVSSKALDIGFDFCSSCLEWTKTHQKKKKIHGVV